MAPLVEVDASYFGEFGGEGTQQPGVEGSGFGILFTYLDQHGTYGNVRGCLFILVCSYNAWTTPTRCALPCAWPIPSRTHWHRANFPNSKRPKWPSSCKSAPQSVGAHS
eukprot:scaffold52910_cov62-Attheya_sp.AAC.2